MADAPAKTPPPPTPIAPGTVFVKNPGGHIHDMNEDDPRTQSVVELAKKSHNSWSLASADEIAAYCELHNLIPPKGKAKAKEAEVKAEEPEPKFEETETAEPEPKAEEKPARKRRGRKPKAA